MFDTIATHKQRSNVFLSWKFYKCSVVKVINDDNCSVLQSEFYQYKLKCLSKFLQIIKFEVWIVFYSRLKFITTVSL